VKKKNKHAGERKRVMRGVGVKQDYSEGKKREEGWASKGEKRKGRWGRRKKKKGGMG